MDLDFKLIDLKLRDFKSFNFRSYFKSKDFKRFKILCGFVKSKFLTFLKFSNKLFGF